MAITFIKRDDIKIGNRRACLVQFQSSADPEVVAGLPLTDIEYVIGSNGTNSVGTISVSSGSVVVKGHGATDVWNALVFGL